MRQTSQGNVVAGVAGAAATVNGQLVFADGRPSGGWRWLVDDVRTVGQAPDAADQYGLWTADVGQTPQAGVVLGFNFIEASGTGSWAAMFVDSVLRTSWGAEQPGDQPIAGASGYIAIRSYTAGDNVRVVNDAGSIVLHLPNAYPQNSDALAVIKDGMLSFWDGRAVAWTLVEIASGLSVPRAVSPHTGNISIPFRVHGRVALLERTHDADLVLRYADETASYLVARWGGIGNETYNPDVAVVGSEIVVVWSAGPGENAPELRRLAVPLDFTTLPIWPEVPPVDPPVDPPPVDPPPADGCADLLKICQQTTDRLTAELAEEREAHRRTAAQLLVTEAARDAALARLQKIPLWLRRIYGA